MTFLAGYLPEEFEEIRLALLNAFNHAIDGENPYALMRVMRSGKKLNREIKGVVVRLLADYPFKHDMAKKLGWKLVWNVPPLREDLYRQCSSIQLAAPVASHPVSGEEIITRALNQVANLGQADAEYMLDNPGEFLPEEFAERIYIFPGTKWKDGGDREYVPCISKNGRQWQLTFHPIAGSWSKIFAFRARTSW